MRRPGDGFCTIIADPPEYKNFCVEIYYDEHFFAEITQEGGIENAQITIAPPPEGADHWKLPYQELLKAISSAYERLKL